MEKAIIGKTISSQKKDSKSEKLRCEKCRGRCNQHRHWRSKRIPKPRKRHEKKKVANPERRGHTLLNPVEPTRKNEKKKKRLEAPPRKEKKIARGSTRLRDARGRRNSGGAEIRAPGSSGRETSVRPQLAVLPLLCPRCRPGDRRCDSSRRPSPSVTHL